MDGATPRLDCGWRSWLSVLETVGTSVVVVDGCCINRMDGNCGHPTSIG